MAKKFDPKAKAKRQKIIAAVGGVLLLGLLAFQIPRTLKMLHQSNASAAATTTSSSATGPTGTTGSLTPPSLAGGNGAVSSTASVSSDGVSDPDVLPAPQSGQLLAFSRFKTKDPFAQQINLDCASGSSESCPGGPAKPATPGSATTKPKPSGGGSGNTRPAGPVMAVKLTSAVISVNGVAETVKVGSAFPASNPTFKLVSVTKTTAKIGIAGGSLASGSQTVTLTRNTPLTLMNTADGTRYLLRLLSVK
jgi:hypothetical protein